MMRISIITPCFNAEQYIAETVVSVIRQRAILGGRAELEYIICDGGSTDNTLAVVESLRNGAMTIVSGPDRGMYDALSKGLSRATGQIVAYINAGDYYDQYAFDVVLDLFETGRARWLTGYQVIYSEKSYAVYFRLPFRYRRAFITGGLYGPQLPMVQQESTFWSASLNALIDYDVLRTLRYAGDFYMWSQFAKVCDLKIVEAHLGGHRRNRGQLSEDMSAYYAEMRCLARKPALQEYALALVDRLLWAAPSKVKKHFNRDGLFRYNHETQEWV